DAVAQLRADPAASLDEAEGELEKALGLDPSALDLKLDLDSSTNAVKGLLINFTQSKTRSASFPLNVDLKSLASLASGDLAKLLQGVTDLVDVSAGADIGVALASTIQLGVGIDLTDPSNPTTFLTEGSGVKIEGRLFGQGLNVRASLGPLGLSIADG